MPNKFTPAFRLINHKLCKAVKRTVYFETAFGVKAYNKPLFHLRDGDAETAEELDPEQLYLGFDGLRDEYTLLEKTIPESPHFDLITRLSHHLPIEDCDYILRERQGSLDGQFEIAVDHRRIEFHKRRYEEALDAILSGRYAPVSVYTVNGKQYVLDGKHRAALSAHLGKRVQCLVIRAGTMQTYPYVLGLYESLSKMRGSYSVNKSHLESLLRMD